MGLVLDIRSAKPRHIACMVAIELDGQMLNPRSVNLMNNLSSAPSNQASIISKYLGRARNMGDFDFILC